MIRVRERFAEAPEPQGVWRTGAALAAALNEVAARPATVAGGVNATFVFDDGASPYTVKLVHGRLSAAPGRATEADTTVIADPLTLSGIVRGRVSGVDAFFKGRLRVRGNLALALRLDGIFERRARPSTRPRPRRIFAAGIDTYYLEAGAGPPVIVLHGLGATNASMIPTLSALSSNYRVIAPDLPGFGESAKPHAEYDPKFFTRWLVGFMDALGIEKARVVGNSMGGRIALEVALGAPERVTKLALLAPSMAFRRFRHAVPLVKFLSPEMGAVPLPLLRPHIDRGVRLLFARPERVPTPWFDAAVDEFLRIFRQPRGRVSLFAAARQIYLEKPFGPRGFWSRLPQLAVPALFVWGDRDRLVPSAFSRHVEDALPLARSVVLRDCGHVPQFELPERTHQLVGDFL